MKTRYLVLSAILLLSIGCAVKYTQEEWLKQMPPPKTIAEGEAMAVLRTKVIQAEAKVDSMAMLDKVKLACIAGVVASIFAICLSQKLFGGAGLIASIVGFVMAYAGAEMGRYIAYAGLVIGVIVGGYAAYIVIRALKEIIGRIEIIKEKDPAVKTLLKSEKLPKQAASTERIIEKIKFNSAPTGKDSK